MSEPSPSPARSARKRRGQPGPQLSPADQIRGAVRQLWPAASDAEIDEAVDDWLSELPARDSDDDDDDDAPQAGAPSIVKNSGTVRFPNGRSVPFILLSGARVDERLEVVANKCEAHEIFAGDVFGGLGLASDKPKCAVDFAVGTPLGATYMETPLALTEERQDPGAARGFSPFSQEGGRLLWEKGDRPFDHQERVRPAPDAANGESSLDESVELRNRLNDSEELGIADHHEASPEEKDIRLVHRYCEHAADACKQMIECISEGQGVFVSNADLGPATQMIGDAIERHDLHRGGSADDYTWIGVKSVAQGECHDGLLESLQELEPGGCYDWPENAGWERWMSIKAQVWDAEHGGSLNQLKNLVADAVEYSEDLKHGVHPYHSHLVFYDETSRNQPADDECSGTDASTSTIDGGRKKRTGLNRAEHLLSAMNEAGVERCTVLANGQPRDLLHIQKRIKAKDAVMLLITGDGGASDLAAAKVLQWKKKKLQNEIAEHHDEAKSGAPGMVWLLLGFMVQQCGIWSLYHDVALGSCIMGWLLMSAASLGILLQHQEESLEFHGSLWLLAVAAFPVWVTSYIYEDFAVASASMVAMALLMVKAYYTLQHNMAYGDREDRIFSWALTLTLIISLFVYGGSSFLPGFEYRDHISACPSQGDMSVLTGDQKSFYGRWNRHDENDGRCGRAAVTLSIFSCFFFLHMTLCNESEWGCVPQWCGVPQWCNCCCFRKQVELKDIKMFIEKIVERTTEVYGGGKQSGDRRYSQLVSMPEASTNQDKWDWRKVAWDNLTHLDKRLVCRLLNKNLLNPVECPYLTYCDVRNLKIAYSLLDHAVSTRHQADGPDTGRGSSAGFELQVPADADQRALICVDISDKCQISNVYKSISQLMTYQSLADDEFGYGRQRREKEMVDACMLQIAEMRIQARFWSRVSDILQTLMFLLQFFTVFLPMYKQMQISQMEADQIASIEDVRRFLSEAISGTTDGVVDDEVVVESANETMDFFDTIQDVNEHDDLAIMLYLVLTSTLVMTILQAYLPQQKAVEMDAAAGALQSEVFLYRCRVGKYAHPLRQAWLKAMPTDDDQTAAEPQSTAALFEERCGQIHFGLNDDDCRHGICHRNRGGKPSKQVRAELRALRSHVTSDGSKVEDSDPQWFARLDDDGFRQLTAQEYFDWRVLYLQERFRGEIVSSSRLQHIFLILKFACSALAVSLVGGVDDFEVAVASQLITLFIHIMLYFGWESHLVRKHEAVKTIEIARSQWRGKNAIEQTVPAIWKPFVREIESAFLMTHGKILQADGPVFGVTDDNVGETASQGTQGGDSVAAVTTAKATGGGPPGGTPRSSWRGGAQAVRATARMSGGGGSPTPPVSRQSSLDTSNSR